VPPRLILASASAARRGLLRRAGLDPEIEVSGADESAPAGLATRQIAALLARRKAEAVAHRHPDALVVGCDSLLELDGRAWAKPASPEEAERRWKDLRGRRGVLCTGHCLLHGATEGRAEEVAATVVCFGWPTDAEIRAYVATGEALGAAGGFTLEGRSAPFIESIEGDPGNVIGLSLPVLRRLLDRLGVGIVDLWR
jgi:septum formation protein